MRCILACLLVAAFRCDDIATIGGLSPEMSMAENNNDSLMGDNTVVVDGTRMKLVNIVVTPFGHEYVVAAHTEEYPDRESLFHPTFVSYWLQTLMAAVATALGLFAPKFLMGLLCFMVILWPISWFANMEICRMAPGSATWWLMAAKSVIVNICPTVPMLLCKINYAKWGPDKMQKAGYVVYGILWANVFWTLFFPWLTDFNFNETCKANWLTGLSLCISLPVHLVAMRKRRIPLFKSDGEIVYGFGTSLCWLVCYTIWNGLFVLSLAPGLTLQDVLFWLIMFALWYQSGCQNPIEDYFAMARPIQLGMYIGLSDWLDLIPYFRTGGIGLDVNRHPYFLFISTFNLLYSFYVMYYEIRLAANPKYGRNYSLHEEYESADGETSESDA